MIYQVNIRPNYDGNNEPGDRYFVEVENGQIFYAVESDGGLVVTK